MQAAQQRAHGTDRFLRPPRPGMRARARHERHSEPTVGGEAVADDARRAVEADVLQVAEQRDHPGRPPPRLLQHGAVDQLRVRAVCTAAPYVQARPHERHTAAVTEHQPDPDHHPRLCDHWWSRPGWRPGRIALTWHLTFPDAPALGKHAAAYQRALDGLPGLNPVPATWLHLTVQAVGYSDEVPAPAVAAVVEAVRSRVAAIEPFDLEFDRPTIYGEAVAIRTRPDPPIERLRNAVRAGIGAALGDGAVPTAPEQADGFLPHVTIAYSRIDADSTPYAVALAGVERPLTIVPITAITLIRQERLLAPRWLYRWTTEATAVLSGGVTAVGAVR